MVAVAPGVGYENLSWGEEGWCFLDYYRNPTRVPGGNPLLMLRHAGGWNVGHHRYYRDSANTEWFYFVRWLLQNQGGYESDAWAASGPSASWDVCTFTSAQHKHTITVIPRSRAVFAMDAVRDMQRAICSIRGMYRTLGFDPNKVIIGGESAGATLASLSQLAPPMLGSGQSNTWRDGANAIGTFDSMCRGIIHSEGPIDFQSYSDTDYFHFSRCGSLFGTDITVADEFNAVSQDVKAALSVREYFVRQDLAGYPGMYALFTQAGDGVKPLGSGAAGSDQHDSSQLTDLLAAAATAGVPMLGQTMNTTELVPFGYAVGSGCLAPPTPWLRIMRPIADWMLNQVQS